MKKIISLCLALICMLGLAACNKTESNSPTIQYPSVQEYVVGQGNIKGNVPVEEFNTEIPHSVRAAECSVEGKSIFAHDKNGKVAAAYDALTKEVTQIERQKDRFRSDGIR